MIDRKRLISWLLLIASLCLIYSWPLQVVFGAKIGYWVFAVISAIIFLLTIDARWPPVLSVYCLIIAFVVLMQMSFDSLSLQQAFRPLALYLFVPLVYGRKVIDEDRFHWLLQALLICVPINIIGILLQLSGYGGDFLVLEQTATLGLVHDRYTSFIGGSLSLGYISMFNAICSLYYLVKSSRYTERLFYCIFLILSLYTLYSSFTRRFYILFIIATILIALYRCNWRYVFAVIVSVLIVLIVLQIGVVNNLRNESYNVRFWDRFISTFDISSDEEGNQYRILKGIQAIDWSLSNPYLGLGVGSVGTIGKSIEELSENFDESLIAEMYYLHIAVDFGIFVALYFFLLMLHLFYKSTVEFLLSGSIIALFLVLYPIDCLSSLELAAPFPAVIFWVCIGLFFPGLFLLNHINRIHAYQK